MSKGSRVTKLHKTEESAIKADLTVQLEAARKAQAEKLDASKDHLIGQLEMAAEKYLTVNGFMQALSTVSQVWGDILPEHTVAARKSAAELAHEMSILARSLSEQLQTVDVNELDESFLDGILVEDFVLGTEFPTSEIVAQMLRVGMLQNVGPVIDDIVSFRVSTNEAIATLEAELAKEE